MPERDPTGRQPHEPGAKLDAGKVRAGLMVQGFANALTAVAEVMSYGAAKYSPNGWRSVPDADERYRDALFRHLLAEASGEQLDPESGLPHPRMPPGTCSPSWSWGRGDIAPSGIMSGQIPSMASPSSRCGAGANFPDRR